MTDSMPFTLVFMLEEKSAEHVLDILLPEIIPGVDVLCIPHQGKSDLQRSIPIKLRAWRVPNTFFVILHDQDSHDCIELKNELRALCVQASGHTPLIRIVCTELEAWYFGDFDAIQSTFPGFNANNYRRRSKYRNPDAIVKPSRELEQIVKGFSKGSAAREIPKHMDIDNNTSTSFNHMVSGIRNFAATQCVPQN